MDFGLEGRQRQLPAPPPTPCFPGHVHAQPVLLPRDADGRAALGANSQSCGPRGTTAPSGDKDHRGQHGWLGAGSRLNPTEPLWGCVWCGVCEAGCLSRRFGFIRPVGPLLMWPRGRRGTRGRSPGGSAGCATAPRPCGARSASAASGWTRGRPSSTARSRSGR